MIGSMIIKGEYIKRDERKWKKGGYVFQYYKLGEFVYHFTNLVVGTNLQLQTYQARSHPIQGTILFALREANVCHQY